MRLTAALVLAAGLSLAGLTAVAAVPLQPFASAAGLPIVKAEYFCSPGYEPSYRGTCVATAARSEVELYVDEPGPAVEIHHYRHHRRHHGLRERF